MADLESMMSEAGDEDDEEEALGMIRRMSGSSQQSKNSLQGLFQQAHPQIQLLQERSSQVKSAINVNTGMGGRGRASLMVPVEALGSILEGTDELDGLGLNSMSGSRPSGSGLQAIAGELRQRAGQADANADRYTALIQHSANLVSEVKSALYDADHAGQAYGAEVLLDEVRAMLTDVSQKPLAEAAQLQRSAEQWLGYRKMMTSQLKSNHAAIDGLIRKRAEFARGTNEERRAECDRRWRQIREWEAELESMPKVRVPGPMGDGSLSPLSSKSPTRDPVQMGGLTLEGAHSLLRAFAAVLQPHMSAIIPRDGGQRTPSEAVALEFLTACSESVVEERKNKSPPPLVVPTLKRCNSAGAVIFGDKVESTKPAGLLPLPLSPDPNRVGGELFLEEQRVLLSQLGESF